MGWRVDGNPPSSRECRVSRHRSPRLDSGPVRRQMQLQGLSHGDVAVMLGLKTRTVQACLLRANPSRGNYVGLTLDRAEDFAHVLGFHPTELWGNDYLDACMWEPPLSTVPSSVRQREWRARRKERV